MIERAMIGCDVAFVQVSPADDDGNHSFGLISATMSRRRSRKHGW
jgi:hypothetical protein